MMFNVEWNKTKKSVEEVMKQYVYNCLAVDNKSTSEIDDNFILNKIDIINCNLLDNYIHINKDEIIKKINFINYVRVSFNKLTTEERKIIYWTYLDKEHSYDDRYIANNLGFSLGYYYSKKKETIIRFAFALGIEVL